MLRYTKIDTYLFVFVQFIFSFCLEIVRSFILFSFVFSIVAITFFRLFYKTIYIFRFFFL